MLLVLYAVCSLAKRFPDTGLMLETQLRSLYLSPTFFIPTLIQEVHDDKQ